MSISIHCTVSLSKKLRGILEDVSQVSLIISDLKNGRGEGVLSLSAEGGISIDEDVIKKIGETSIMVTPTYVSEEVPGAEYGPVGAIFSTNNQPLTKKTKRDPVDRLAATEIPEKKDIPHAIIAKNEIETPKEFREVDIPACRSYIANMDDLLKAIAKAKHKPKVELDLSSAQNERQKSIMIAEAEQAEGIDEQAWLVNDKYANLTINDLGLDLNLNSPISLGSIPARKLALSSDLKSVIKGGMAKFISPDEISDYMESMVSGASKAPSLEVFSSASKAEENMILSSSDLTGESAEEMDLDESELEKPFEQESMILNLTASLPLERSPSHATGTTKTVHGSRVSSASTASSAPQRSANPNIKPIRKLD